MPHTPKVVYMVFTKTENGTNDTNNATKQSKNAYFPTDFCGTCASTETPEDAAVVSIAQYKITLQKG